MALFDRKPYTFNATKQDSYVTGNGYQTDDSYGTGYAPREQGTLSLLGKALTGIAAPFAGDYQWLQNETAQQLRQQQADQEFQSFLMKNAMEKQKTSAVLKSRAEGQQLLKDALSGGGRMEGYIAKPYISASGGVGVQYVQDPEVQAARGVTTAARKKLDAQLPSIASTLKSIEDVEKYARLLPESKPGVLEQTFAKGKAAIGNYSADKRYTDFQAGVNKLKTQAARSVMQEVGNLAATEQENALKTFGDAPIPLENKLSNLNNLKGSVLSGVNALLQSAGMSLEDLKSKHPEVYSRLLNSSTSTGSSNGNASGSWDNAKESRYQELLKKRQGK